MTNHLPKGSEGERQQCPLCGAFLPKPPTHCPNCGTEFDVPPDAQLQKDTKDKERGHCAE